MCVHVSDSNADDLRGHTMANPTERDEQVSIRLSADLRASLERLARDQDRSLSSQIRFLVVQALESRNEQRQVAA